jgi:hypothetical protein
LAVLRDSEGANIAIGLRIKRWLDGKEYKPRRLGKKQLEERVGLNSAVSGVLSIHAGGRSIEKPTCVFSLEEIADLASHIRKLIDEQIEDEFEWSTLEKSAQPLRVLREGGVLHAELNLGLAGYPEEYAGSANIQVQFDTSDRELKKFGKELEAELGQLLKKRGTTLSDLRRQLEEKVNQIRRTGANPYSRSSPG